MTKLLFKSVSTLALVVSFLLCATSVSAEQQCSVLSVDGAPIGLQATTSVEFDAPLPTLPGPAWLACICGTGGTTPSDVPLSWGMGSSCTAATADLDANTQQLANELCWDVGAEGACSFGSLQITTACYLTMGQYQVDGYRTYKCLRCIEPPPREW